MENTKIYYKGRGEHSVKTLETIIEQLEEELHLIRSGQSTLPSTEERKTAEYELNKAIDIYVGEHTDGMNPGKKLYKEEKQLRENFMWFVNHYAIKKYYERIFGFQLSEAKREIDRLKDELLQVKNSEFGLQHQLSEANKEIGRLRVVVIEKSQENTKLKKEIERLKDSLAHSIHAGKETEKEFVRLKKSEASLQSELSAMRERVDKAERERLEFMVEADWLKNEVTELKTYINEHN